MACSVGQLPGTGRQNNRQRKLRRRHCHSRGVVFIGSTRDEKFRAFDSASGRLLGEWPLPAGGYACPATYRVNGKQYVVIAAGGGGKSAPAAVIAMWRLPCGYSRKNTTARATKYFEAHFQCAGVPRIHRAFSINET
jgi:hypothetical protein